jgi:hypothetical protein
MNSVLRIASALLTGLLLCTAIQAQKTTAAFDPTANFSTYKTFSFDKGGARNPFVNKMIIAAVERELTSRGLTRVDANPDLLVVYLAASGFNVQVASVPFYHVVNPAYSGLVVGGARTMWDVTTGTMVIDLFDKKADRIVFRGTAKAVLQRAPSTDAAADAKTVSKIVKKSIAKIFKKYPRTSK